MLDFKLFMLMHLTATLFMTGVIWVIQLVHYPSFLFVEKNNFVDFEKFHSKQISMVVIPIMLIELATSFILISQSKLPNPLLIVNLLLLVAIWITTFVFSARYHKCLIDGYNKEYILKLIGTNWIRTIFWTLRSFLLLFLFLKLLN